LRHRRGIGGDARERAEVMVEVKRLGDGAARGGAIVFLLARLVVGDLEHYVEPLALELRMLPALQLPRLEVLDACKLSLDHKSQHIAAYLRLAPRPPSRPLALETLLARLLLALPTLLQALEDRIRHLRLQRLLRQRDYRRCSRRTESGTLVLQPPEQLLVPLTVVRPRHLPLRPKQLLPFDERIEHIKRVFLGESGGKGILLIGA
jgi:hypothetical protein